MEEGKFTSYKNREGSQKEAINEKVPEYQVNTMKYE